ncbi:MAG: DUF4118 domain-containing protein [Betaproteobacteria bacterium]|jgi:two-component system sensor histidine kinase KdpD|nr:DUF4118 domain-containing protein [Betaproteobacteria bacterium]MBK8918018.1 DUF4118 domain-containing protein [Betaproteobacteria bacterium]
MSAGRPFAATPRPPWQRFALAVAAIAAVTAAAMPLLGHLDLANIVMLFLLAVLGVALRLGRGPALLAAFLAVGAFDFFFVPPRFSMTVHDGQYLITFAVMLAAALLTAELAAGLARQADEAARREALTRALYEMARELAGAPTLDEVTAITRRFVAAAIGARVVLLLPDRDQTLRPHPDDPELAIEPHLARLASTSTNPVECHGLAADGYASAYFPLRGPSGMRGVAAVAPGRGESGGLRPHQALLATMASLVAIALERVHYVEAAQASRIDAAGERLRSSVLSALSHDLRTPLTALVGMADALAQPRPGLPPETVETAAALRDQARRMAGLVANLLDMARLQSGRVSLKKEWQSLEEIVGAAIHLLGPALADHPVRTALAPDLPLVEFDAVLIERVLGNLLENAAKYSPPGTPIDVSASLEGACVSVSVSDRGSGFPADCPDLFASFVRGRSESPQPGVGLGLSICRAIVEAHGGTIRIGEAEGGGARVSFTLPAGIPPSVEEEALPEGTP